MGMKVNLYTVSQMNAVIDRRALKELVCRGNEKARQRALRGIKPDKIAVSPSVSKDITTRQPVDVSVIEMSPAAVSSIKLPEMVKIPSGKFTMGSTKYEDEQPIREVTITKSFALGKYEVTNEEYKVYLEATGQEVPSLIADPAKARHPVVEVSWQDAVKYCKRLSETTGRKFRLPTEAEWEYAARGTEGRNYPWKGDFDSSKVTFNTSGTKPVDAHADVDSPFGTKDQAGNVWEWVNDWYQDKYNPEDLVDPKGAKSGNSKVLRGGSWCSGGAAVLRGADRDGSHPEDQGADLGFRLAEDI